MRVLLLVVTMIATPAAGQTKPPWEWTLEERVAARFDPDNIRERDETYVASHPQLRSHHAEPPPPRPGEIRYRIDGSRNPELFLPHELFDALLNGLQANPTRASANRRVLARPLKLAGFDPDRFWPALASVASAYLPFRGREALGNAEVTERCRARIMALEAARRLFGPEKFDRMLYTVVAPAFDHSEGTTFPDPASRLLRAAHGCDDSAN